ncbi:MAG: bifunctional 5,10-methylenetetrahydrofolate dehydrogenase/5,10-methenyltetrahydrofolate cyclohydrolase [Promethearchaeota archaeon]
MYEEKIIDGKKIAAQLRQGIKREVGAFAGVRPPCLATMLVGDNPASKVYIGIKGKACDEVGIKSKHVTLPGDIGLDELEGEISALNSDPEVDGILIQLPLPGELRAHESDLVNLISPDKDVDGFTYFNNGLLMHGHEGLVACTPRGIVHLLETSGVALEGANVVVINRSKLVGKPLIFLLLNRNATVTVCHSKTRDLPKVCRRADIVVVAVGRPNFLTPEYVGDGAVVIDVGTNRVDGKLVGDTDFEALLPKVSKITPSPGGVGPMTVAMLLKNTVDAWKAHLGLSDSVE